MKIKTIKELNEKAWYRLLKVSFILLFLVSILIGNSVNIGEGIGRIDDDKTIINCRGKDERMLTAKQVGVYFGNYEFINGFNYKNFYEGYYNKYEILDILEACYDEVPLDDVYTIQRIYEIKGFNNSPKQYDEEYLKQQINLMTVGYKSDQQKMSYLNYSVHLFDIEPVFNYREFIIIFLILNAVIVFIFELIRRVFYYIVLGKIKPDKK